jgi:two-component sensor histidine kinase
MRGSALPAPLFRLLSLWPAWGSHRSFTLRQHLYALVLASTLPLIALAIYLSLDRLAGERQANRTSLMVNARVLAAGVDSELDTYLAVINTLSKSPSLLAGNFEAFWQEAKEAAEFTPGAWVIVADPGGRQLLNTLRPFGEPLPARTVMPWMERAFASKRPFVSDVYRGALAQRAVASVEVPVFRDGAPLYSLAISFEPKRFLELLQRQRYPPEWLLGILDRQGNFVARIPDNDARVGTPASEGWLAEIAHSPEGWGEHLSLERERVHSAHSSTRHGWVVGLSVPEAILYAPARRSAFLLAILSTAILALSLVLAWLVASRIAQPTASFSTAAAEMTKGQVPSIEKTGVTEFDGVVTQFEAAAGEIRNHTAKQQTLLHELSHRVKNQLAVIQSLVMRTLQDHRTVGEARAVLLDRLQALGRVHDHLMRSDWRGASLKEIVEAELAPFSARVHVQGPDLMVAGHMVQTLSLVLHELATNASKHGSLSNDVGSISIRWHVIGLGDDARLAFRWEERDGPRPKPPTRKGFGSTLLETALPAEHDAKPRLLFGPTGFVYEFQTRLSDVTNPDRA